MNDTNQTKEAVAVAGTGSSGAAKIVRNAFYGFTTWIFPSALTFVVTKVLVESLGHHEYGLYSLVYGVLAYSFTFGIGRALTKYVAEYKASGQDEKINDVVAAMFFLNVAVGVVGCATIFLLSGYLVGEVFRLEEAARPRTVLALQIAGGTIFFVLMTQVFGAILQGLQRFDVYSKLFNLISVSMLIGNLLIALSGLGLIALFVWNVTAYGIGSLLFFVAARRLLPQMRLLHRFRGAALKLIVSYSASVVAYQILGNFLVLFERTWVTRHLGAESLTHYVVPMTVSLQIHYFIASLVLVVFPLASELQNEREKLLRLYQKATKIIFALVVPICLSVVVLSRQFLTLWLGEDFAAAAANLLIIHTISLSLVAAGTVAWHLTEGLGYPSFNCLIIALSLMITVPLVIYLGEIYGAEGVALGRLAGFSVMFWAIFFVERWFFGKVSVKFWLSLLLKLLAAAAAAAFVEKMLGDYFSLAWTSFIFSGLCGLLVYAGVLWAVGFVSDDEKALLRRIAKLG